MNRAALINTAIVGGRGAEAQDALRRWLKKGLAREDFATFALLASRAGLPELGVRVLHPCVRAHGRRAVPASSAERAVYGHLLVKHGALDEGEQLLASLDESAGPELLYFRMAAHVARWDYAASIPLLERYVAQPDIAPYRRLTAYVNLAIALVYERRDPEAGAMLGRLLHDTGVRRAEKLHGTILEACAEHAMARGDWSRARAFLAAAEAALGGVGSQELLVTRKYRAVIEYLERGDGDAVRRVRAEALARPHPETVRDCDRLLALGEGDRDLLLRVYFGTPHAAFRARLREDAGRLLASPPAEYALHLGEAGAPRVECPLADVVEPGGVPYRLLQALVQDLYRPPRIASLFARVYPERFFDPETSPDLIYDAMARVREAFASRRLPLVIEESHGFYRLTATASFRLRLPTDERPARRHDRFLEELRARFRETSFSLAESAGVVDLPRRTLQRLLADAAKENRLARRGHGRSVRYRFAG